MLVASGEFKLGGLILVAMVEFKLHGQLVAMGEFKLVLGVRRVAFALLQVVGF